MFKMIHQQETHNFNTRKRLFLTHKIKYKFAESKPGINLKKIDKHSNIGFKLYMRHLLWDKYTTESKKENCYICQQ